MFYATYLQQVRSIRNHEMERKMKSTKKHELTNITTINMNWGRFYGLQQALYQFFLLNEDDEITHQQNKVE